MGRPKKEDKLSGADYAREWRRRTGRTKVEGVPSGAAHYNDKLSKHAKKILKLKEEGHTNQYIGGLFGVSEAAIRKFCKRIELAGV